MALKSSEDTSRRVARMHLACAQDGKIQGRIAYGWGRTGPNKGTIRPDEAEIVRKIFNDCLSGETAYGIATEFNHKGIARRDAVVERQGQQNAPQSALLRHGLVRRPAPG